MADEALLIDPTVSDETNPEVTANETDNTSENLEMDVESNIEEKDDKKADDGTGTEEDKADADVKADGRALPKELQAALKKFREDNPTMAKSVKSLVDAYFHNKAFRDIFPDTKTATVNRDLFNQLGGEEGVAKLQSNSNLLENVVNDIQTGNESFVKDAFEDFPDGAKKLAPVFLSELQTHDPKAFADTVRPHFMNALDECDFAPAVNALAEALNSKDYDKAMKIAKSFGQWYMGIKTQVGAGNGSGVKADPERQKFETEKKQWNEQKESNFRSDIGRSTNKYLNDTMEKDIKPYIGKLSVDAQKDLVQGINGEIQRLLKADKSYQTNLKSMLAAKNRNSDSITRFVNAKLEEIIPQARKLVYERRYGKTPIVKTTTTDVKPGDKKVTNKIGGSEVVIEVNKKPASEEIDKTKTTQNMIITGRAYLKSGKLVSWAKTR